jgi:hypothetical protein
MRYLEDTLAEQCLSKTLYPNTKIHVRRKKVEGTLMTYTNDIEVEVDFSDVDPNLLDESTNKNQQSITTVTKSNDNSLSLSDDSNDKEPDFNLNGSNLDDEELKPVATGKAARFFRKKN